MAQPVVYVLYSSSLDSYYIGSTDNIDRRLHEHLHHTTRYTSKARDWRPVFVFSCSTLREARQIEYRLKMLKDRRIIKRIVQIQRIIYSA